ncbi:MAG: hypothetical protein RIT28_1565 [Pseudomonadota bacterium]
MFGASAGVMVGPPHGAEAGRLIFSSILVALSLGGEALAQPVLCHSDTLTAPTFTPGAFGVLVLGVRAPSSGEGGESEPLSDRLQARLAAEVRGPYGQKANLKEDGFSFAQVDCAVDTPAQAWAAARAWGAEIVIFPGAGGLVHLAHVGRNAPSASIDREMPLFWRQRAPDTWTVSLFDEERVEAVPMVVIGMHLLETLRLGDAEGYLEEAYDLLVEAQPGSAALSLATLARAQAHANMSEAARLSVQDAISACGVDDRCLGAMYEERAYIAWATRELPLSAATLERASLKAEAANDNSTLARLQYAMGRVREAQGQRAGALESLRAAEDAFKVNGDARAELWCALGRVQLRVFEGYAEEVRAELETLPGRFDMAGEPDGQIAALDVLGTALSALGEPALALAAHDEALKLAQARGDESAQAMATSLGAAALAELGQLPEAITRLERALFLYEVSRDPRTIGPTQAEIGRLYQRSGDERRAQSAWERSVELCRQSNLHRCEVQSLASLSISYLSTGERALAMERLDKAIQRVQDVGDTRWEAELRLQVARASELSGDKRTALEQSLLALELAQKTGDRILQAELTDRAATAHAALGEEDRALALWRDALPMLLAVDELGRAVELWFTLDEIYTDRATPAEGLPLGLSLLPRLGEVPDPLLRQTFLKRLLALAEASPDNSAAVAQILAVYAPELRAQGDTLGAIAAWRRCAELRAAAGDRVGALAAYEAANALAKGALKAEAPKLKASLEATGLTGKDVDALKAKMTGR